MTEERFDVWVFIQAGDEEVHDRAGSGLTAEAAMRLFESYIRPGRPANMLGIINEVRVVDTGDMCVAQWKKGEGIVWPKPDKGGQGDRA
jgi:hypothetical protein